MRSVLTIFLVSTLYIGSVFWATQEKTFRWDSDYDSNLPIIAYVVDTVRNERRFPLWNPYISSTGISVLGDPLSAVTYLPYLLPMLLFGVPEGLWVVIGLHAFLAGMFMWMLLRERLEKPGFLRSKPGFELALWGGLLYMGAGAFAARVAAGHIEKVLSYAWYPLLLMALLKKEQTIRTAALTGVVMGVVFLTGDVYGLLFMGIWYGVIGVIRGIREIRGVGVVREVIITASSFVFVGSVKLIPFVLYVLPVIVRYSTFDAAKGSLHAFFAWIPFVVPFGVSFYDRPVFQRLLGFWYNWYEYYAFIGLPMVFLFWLPKVIKRRETHLLLLLLFVGLLYVARGYPYSVFYWLEKSVPVLSGFRAPQRMYGALTSVVVALIVLCAKRVIRPPLALRHAQGKPQGVALNPPLLLWLILLVTFFMNAYQMTQGFEKPRRDEEVVVRQLRRRDAGDMTVATFACCMQTFLVRERIRVINYYYGWLPFGAPRFVNTSGEGFDLTPLTYNTNDKITRPTYIIAPEDMSVGPYGYEVWFREGNIIVWRVSTFT